MIDEKTVNTCKERVKQILKNEAPYVQLSLKQKKNKLVK